MQQKEFNMSDIECVGQIEKIRPSESQSDITRQAS